MKSVSNSLGIFKSAVALVLACGLAWSLAASGTPPAHAQAGRSSSSGNRSGLVESATLGRASSSSPAPGAPAIDPARLAFQQVATGLSSPVFVTNAGDGSGRLFILEKPGRIRIVENGSLLSQPFLDITSLVRSTYGEQGLLGLAFHPSYGSTGDFYVAYTAPRPSDDTGSVLTLERFTVSGDPDLADANSGSIILTIDHPTNTNHNGGMIAFGPDGYLYWSTGDGGSGGDPPNNAQNLGVLLGKLLRLDVDSESPYAVPPTNPFHADSNPLTRLIWAYGLRNSWRYSFDRLTGDLYIGDVGQDAWEEIDLQRAGDPGGENYGWRLMEGFHCYNPPADCDPGHVTTLPVVEYTHDPECAVTGGYVYRGSAFPTLFGQYFYGDFCSGKVWSLQYKGGWTPQQLADTSYNISSFGEGDNSDLYLVDLGGSVYRIVYDEPARAPSDFDGDGKTDAAVFEKTTGNWFTVGSSDGFFAPALNFGNDTDYIPVPGDYDGDGKADPAVFEKATGNWFAVGSTDGFSTPALGFGNDTKYIPVPGDYDGDGKTDAAVFEKSSGNWFVVGSTDGFFAPALAFGNDTNYIPVPGDYDGDGKTDPAVFEKATGNWFAVGSTDGFSTPALGFGNDTTYIPVPGDYDGDVKTDPAVFEKSSGNWFVVGSTDGFFTPALSFGSDTGYIPQQGDYDGDGKTDPAVFEKSSGNWFVVGSTAGFFTPALGFGNDTSYIAVVK